MLLSLSSAKKSFVPIVILLVGMAYPGHPGTFSDFGKLDDSTKAEFIADMVYSAAQALNGDGSPELALKMGELFTKIERGEHISKGMRQLEKNLDKIDAYDKAHPDAEPHYVEEVFFITLSNNGIELSRKDKEAVFTTTLKFQPLTNAGFHAQSPSEQRRIIKLFSEIAIQDFGYRKMAKENTFLGLNERTLGDLDNTLKQEFPILGEQSGFAGVVKEIEADRAKTPDRGGIVIDLAIYLMDQIEVRIQRRDKELEGRSVLLPDGRHAYVDSDGSGFLIFRDDGTSYKLEPGLVPLARRLRHCMETGAITDGPRAQAACLEKEKAALRRNL